MEDLTITEAEEPIESTIETEPETAGEDAALETAESTEGAEETDQPASAVWRDVKEKLKDSPQTYRQVKKALHAFEDMGKRLPDGIEKAVERLDAISQLDDDPEDPDYVPGSRPFDEIVSNTLAERSFWRDYDTAYQAGDPRIINQMVEANPGAFEKLIVPAMDRYAEMNPDGFSTYVCRSVDGYLTKAEIPLQLALMERVLPEDSNDPGLKTVIQAFKAIKAVVGEIKSAATREIAAKNQTTAVSTLQQPQGTPSLEERELNVRHNEWLPEIRGRSESFAAQEALKIAGKTKFTAAEISTIQKAVRGEVQLRVSANRPYQTRIKGFLKANNKAAFTSTVESEHKKIIPGAVKRAVQDVLEKRKTAPKPTEQKKPLQGAQTQTQGEEKFERISGPPRTVGLKVDLRRTSNAMLAKNKAYIEGRKNPVFWERK